MRMRTESAPPIIPPAIAKARYIVPMSLWLVESSQRVNPQDRPCGPSSVVVVMVAGVALASTARTTGWPRGSITEIVACYAAIAFAGGRAAQLELRHRTPCDRLMRMPQRATVLSRVATVSDTTTRVEVSGHPNGQHAGQNRSDADIVCRSEWIERHLEPG